MTDQTATPPATVPADTDPVWRRLVMDCAAYQRAYPTPAHLAELVMQAITAGAAHGIARVQLSATTRPAPPTPMQLAAEVLDEAARKPGDPSTAALHALAHAGQRERAARHARTETPAAGDETNGGNCGG